MVGTDNLQRDVAQRSESSRRDFEILVDTAAKLSAGWAASGRNMSAREAVAEAHNIINEAAAKLRRVS